MKATRTKQVTMIKLRRNTGDIYSLNSTRGNKLRREILKSAPFCLARWTPREIERRCIESRLAFRAGGDPGRDIRRGEGGAGRSELRLGRQRQPAAHRDGARSSAVPRSNFIVCSAKSMLISGWIWRD